MEDVGGSRLSLVADCGACVGLCCVAPSFTASHDFALSKPPGTPCPHLDADDGCTIHDRLRGSGFRGCAVFDCFGAGQRLSQGTFAGESWRTDPARARLMFDAFPAMRDLHEQLWYITDALGHIETPELRAAVDQLTTWVALPADELAGLDTLALWEEVVDLISGASELVRAGIDGRRDLAGADLAGADLRGADLRGADLRGADLTGAALSGADLALADVLGTQFRDADLAGADLSHTLFLIQAQLATAIGDGATRVGPVLRRPPHWR